MAFAIEIILINEDVEWVNYHHKSPGRNVKFGKIRIAKAGGDVELIENAEDDVRMNCIKLSVSLIKTKGIYDD